VQYAEADIASAFLRWSAKLVLGTVHTAAHLTVLLATNSVLDVAYNFFAESHNVFVKVPGIALYTALMIIIGGILQQNPFFIPPEEFLRKYRQRQARRTESHSTAA